MHRGKPEGSTWLQHHDVLAAAALAPILTHSPCRVPRFLSVRLPQKIGKRSNEISVVSVMPCVRKQGEADRMMFHTPDGAAR